MEEGGVKRRSAAHLTPYVVLDLSIAPPHIRCPCLCNGSLRSGVVATISSGFVQPQRHTEAVPPCRDPEGVEIYQRLIGVHLGVHVLPLSSLCQSVCPSLSLSVCSCTYKYICIKMFVVRQILDSF